MYLVVFLPSSWSVVLRFSGRLLRHWRNGSIYVDGRVKDALSDGRCARVKALINGQWYYSEKACPNGTTKSFSWHGSGSAAYVYTYVE